MQSGVSIPKRVTSIGKDAFYGCDNLSIIYGAADSYAHTYAVGNGYTFKNNGQLILGDVDRDTEITLTDVNLALKAALTISPLEKEQEIAVDADDDGEITLNDVNMIFKAALGIIHL